MAYAQPQALRQMNGVNGATLVTMLVQAACFHQNQSWSQDWLWWAYRVIFKSRSLWNVVHDAAAAGCRRINAQAPSTVVMRAGPSGATIVACPSSSSDFDELPSSSADEQ